MMKQKISHFGVTLAHCVTLTVSKIRNLRNMFIPSEGKGAEMSHFGVFKKVNIWKFPQRW